MLSGLSSVAALTEFFLPVTVTVSSDVTAASSSTFKLVILPVVIMIFDNVLG